MPSDLSRLRVLDPSVIEKLQESLGADAHEVLAQAVSIFFTDSATHLQTARDAVARGDWTRVGQVAHRLKGGALQLGAERMLHVAALLEDAARRDDSGAAAVLVDSLIEAFNETTTALRQLGFNRHI
jgi:HPt (histidine-containing phosphotransfer) domain-containing protein